MNDNPNINPEDIDLDEEIDDVLERDIEGPSELYKEMKQNIGICQNCGKAFEQGFRTDKKTGKRYFNKYKYCYDCRHKMNRSLPKEKVVSIKYNPYEWQKKFHASKAKYKVVSGAARTGKDYSFDKEFDEKFVNMLNEDRPYSLIPRVHGWVVGPTYKLLAQIERNFMGDFPRELVVNYDKENHVIETINGGLIEFRSADDPDSLVSVGLDICYITEAARIKQLDVVIGNITDRIESPGRGPNGDGGLLLVNSSPRGRTYFNTICKWGEIESPSHRPFWETWYVSRWDNPSFAAKRYKYKNSQTGKWDRETPERAGDRTYEEDLMLSRSDRQYREDILGLPSDQDGSQFPNFREYAVIDKPNLPKEELKEYKQRILTPVPGYTYSIGFDPAKYIDGSCLTVYCENTGEAVQMKKLQNVAFSVQINVYIKELVEKWNHAIVRYGKTGLGEALEDLFIQAGLSYIAYPEQGHNKEKLVENLTTLVKSGRFKIHNLDDTTELAIREFEDYIYEMSPKNQTIVYHNGTVGFHDDFVSSSYFATADVVSGNTEDLVNSTFDMNDFKLLQNKYNTNKRMAGSFF